MSDRVDQVLATIDAGLELVAAPADQSTDDNRDARCHEHRCGPAFDEHVRADNRVLETTIDVDVDDFIRALSTPLPET